MSASKPIKTLTPPDILARKNKDPIVCLTAYTTPMAQLADQHCDLILVGDSVGMVMHGMSDTLGVTMEMMIMHAKAVRKGLSRALMVVDMPFGSYEQSPEQAFENATILMRETGCSAVKLEGGETMVPTIEFLTQRAIPVMAHIGLTPQSIHNFGGYKTQGEGKDSARIIKDAKAITKAGAFSVVCEKIPDPLARKITRQITIPTIGIGASAQCDGQILVIDDMLGMFTQFKPKFVKRYTHIADDIDTALGQYAQEVRERQFPGPDHVYGLAPKNTGK